MKKIQRFAMTIVLGLTLINATNLTIYGQDGPQDPKDKRAGNGSILICFAFFCITVPAPSRNSQPTTSPSSQKSLPTRQDSAASTEDWPTSFVNWILSALK